MTKIVQAFSALNASRVEPNGAETDNGPWGQEGGVPLASLGNNNERYFWFHHSRGDTMNVYTSDELDAAAAVYATTAIQVAQLPSLLPRDPKL